MLNVLFVVFFIVVILGLVSVLVGGIMLAIRVFKEVVKEESDK